jgi:putative nucleotidyltransferase with HDIG domain
MPADINQPSESPSSSSQQTVKNGDRADVVVRKSAQESAAEHHYEPEAHHEWFPSEQFFIAWMTVGCSGFLLLCLAMTAHHIFNPGFRAGDIAERDIRAPFATIVPDEVATKAARDKVRAEQLPVFITDRTKDSATFNQVKKNLDCVTDLQKIGLKPQVALAEADHLALLKASGDDFDCIAQNTDGKLSDDLNKLKSRLKSRPNAADTAKLLTAIQQERTALAAYVKSHPDVTDAEEEVAISVAPADLAGYRGTVTSALQRLFRALKRLPIDDNSVWKDTAVEFFPDAWSEGLRKASAVLCTAQIQPNVTIDKAATEARADRAAASVKPIMKQISVGQLIVPKHAEITPDAVSTMQAMGITDFNRWPIIIGLWISLAAAVSLIGLFLYTFDAKFLFSTRSLALMYSVGIVTISLAALLGKTYPQIIPLPAIALVLAIFFGQRTAIAIALPLAIFLAVDRLIDFNNLVALGTAAGAAIGTYSRRRHALMSTGLVIGMAQAFGFLAALAVSQTSFTATELGSQLGLEFLGGIASSIAAIGTLPFLENIFGLVTPFRLAELTDADQPLLRRLEENAPGTYQHSLAVANLAEAGARAIGGDVNLVRAGAYYHDVGKMVRPKFFIENQLGATNPHDSMTPEQSRERVLAHVTDGLSLAKQYALPKAVQDFIPMHQGTSLMAYFYHKACMRDGVDKVDPMFYRYPGPKPQSKETSIVMLADVSEAVTHSMKDPSEEEVETAISKVFQNRWDDGQFNESGLAYTELQRVKKAFVRVWRTLHHDRLKYPSTTTGRMPVPPSNMPSASSLSNIVAGNEFAADVPEPKGTTNGDSTTASTDNATDTGTASGASTEASGSTASRVEAPSPADPTSPKRESDPGCC